MQVEEKNWVGKSLEIKGREELINGMKSMRSGKTMETNDKERGKRNTCFSQIGQELRKDEAQ